MEDLKVRGLQVEDLFTMAAMISKCFKELMTATQKAGIGLKEFEENVKGIKKEDSDKDFEVFGIKLFEIIYNVAKSDIKPFMADLVGVSVEEFTKLSFQAPLVILEQLAEKEDLPGFFQRVLKLVEIFKPSGKKPTS